MSSKQRGLGKGLSALLGDAGNLDSLRSPVGYVNKDVVGAKDPQDTADVLRIPVNMIEPNPFQPRMSFDQDSLQELAASIRTFGLIQPITVRKKSADRYQIISGERRFKACQLAGMDMVPAYIRDAPATAARRAPPHGGDCSCRRHTRRLRSSWMGTRLSFPCHAAV